MVDLTEGNFGRLFEVVKKWSHKEVRLHLFYSEFLGG